MYPPSNPRGVYLTFFFAFRCPQFLGRLVSIVLRFRFPYRNARPDGSRWKKYMSELS